MNTSKRLFFGVLSCFLLAAGFAGVADRLDPLTPSLQAAAGGESPGAAQGSCTMPCSAAPGQG